MRTTGTVLTTVLDIWAWPGRRWRATAALAVALLIAVTTALVHLGGGTQTATLHVMYLPVIAAAVTLGAVGGVAAGVAAGLALGPWMPQDVAAGVFQSPFNWLLRLGFFAAAGLLAGVAASTLRRYTRLLRDNAFRSRETRLPTISRLATDMQQQRTNGQPLRALVVIAVTNFGAIARTLGFGLARHIPAAIAARIGVDGGVCYEVGADLVAVAYFGEPRLQPEPARALEQRLQGPVSLGETGTRLETVCGEYRADGTETEPDEAIRRACSALFDARAHGRLVSLYTPTMEREARENRRILGTLAERVRADTLRLQYQPRVDLAAGRITGVEALVRLPPPDGGIPADRFIGLAEHSNLILALTERVASGAVERALALRHRGHALTMAINFSVRTLRDPDAVDRLRSLVEASGIPPSAVEIEITESAVVEDLPAFRRTIHHAHALGFTIAIDDFGAGYTTLAHLGAMPVDILKLDRSLVQGIHANPRQQAIVGALIDLGRTLGCTVVGEGVEDRQTLALLQSAGCHEAQGFHLARPMEANTLERWLDANRGHCQLAVG